MDQSANRQTFANHEFSGRTGSRTASTRTIQPWSRAWRSRGDIAAPVAPLRSCDFSRADDNGAGAARRPRDHGNQCGRQARGVERRIVVGVRFETARSNAHTPSKPCRFQCPPSVSLGRRKAACRPRVSRAPCGQVTSALHPPHDRCRPYSISLRSVLVPHVVSVRRGRRAS